MSLNVLQGDITTLAVDAIVNAANPLMLGGAGVDGAIHAAAGDELFDACFEIPEVSPGVRCPTGTAQITPAFNLQANWVIHTAGPVWRGGTSGEENLLRSCYRNSLKIALGNQLKSIAFPAISCGAFGYPIERAVAVSIDEIMTWLKSPEQQIEVTLVAFAPDVYEVMKQELDRANRAQN